MTITAQEIRETYEKGGWKDGRLGQAYDLVWAALEDRGVTRPAHHPLIDAIAELDDQP